MNQLKDIIPKTNMLVTNLDRLANTEWSIIILWKGILNYNYIYNFKVIESFL